MEKYRSPLAIGLGLICTTATLVVLFGHVRSIDDLTLTHLYIVLSLIVAMGAGHFMWDAFSQGGFGVLMGSCLAALFIVGTLICVSLAGGRSADIIEAREKSMTTNADQVAKLKEEVEQARKDWQEAKDQSSSLRNGIVKSTQEAASTCATGRGNACKGQTETLKTTSTTSADIDQAVDRLERKYRELDTRLRKLQTTRDSNGELRHIARSIAIIFGLNEKVVFDKLTSALPYLLSFVGEFGAIVFLKYGTARIPATPSAPTPVPPSNEPGVSLKTIADELGIDDRHARKYLRGKVPRPELGWIWPKSEAQHIKTLLIAQSASSKPLAPSP